MMRQSEGEKVTQPSKPSGGCHIAPWLPSVNTVGQERVRWYGAQHICILSGETCWRRGEEVLGQTLGASSHTSTPEALDVHPVILHTLIETREHGTQSERRIHHRHTAEYDDFVPLRLARAMITAFRDDRTSPRSSASKAKDAPLPCL
eukprot:755515-Hanusia_phi.AAC.3